MHDDLSIPPETMRAMGYRVIDAIVEHIESLPNRRVGQVASPKELSSILEASIPMVGQAFDDIVSHVLSDVLRSILHLDHPRFFAFIPGPSDYAGVLAEALAAGFNVFSGTWFEASGPAAVERVTVDWMRQLCGMPESAGGLFVSGGSMANLTALALAREVKAGHPFHDARVYYSDQTHSSVDRALMFLGFAKEQGVYIASDALGRIEVGALRERIAQDRANGLRPICVVANAGTTNSGAIDDMHALADLCAREEVWLHADGAYGAAAVLTHKGKALLRGLERVDSLTLDPHKWLFQPYECGLLLVRDAALLRETFHVLPDYLKDAEASADAINFADYGVQLTRSFRALKVWMTFQLHGLDAIRSAVQWGSHLAEYTEQRLRAMEGWRVITPAQIGIVTFRCEGGVDDGEIEALNDRLSAALLKTGVAILSTTVLRGRKTLRMCTINPRTTERDIDTTLAKLDELARTLRP